jgi:hypothetical protein
MHAFRLIVAATCLSVLGTAQILRAADEVVQIKDLPKVVADAIKKKYPDAELVKAKKKINNGNTFFGVGFKAEGAERSILLTDKGKIAETKKVIPASEVPAKVVEAVYASYPNSTTKKAEKVTAYKEEKTLKLEIVTSDHQTKKLVMSADGKIISAK